MPRETQTKEAVLLVAKRLFAQHGFTGASMELIARSVGIKKASLYTHYKTKDEIFLRTLLGIVKDHTEAMVHLVRVNTVDSTIESLKKIFVAYVNHCYKNLDVEFWTRFYYFPPEHLRPEILKTTFEYEDQFKALLKQIVVRGIERTELRSIDPDQFLFAFYHMLIGLVMSLDEYDDHGPESNAQRCVETFLSGFTP